MATHQQHHYVPRFLLEQWHGAPDDKLTSFRWAHGELTHKRYAAKSVAKRKHLYSMQLASSDPDVRVERDYLGPSVDEPASVAHKIILKGGVRSLARCERIDWARFLVSLMLRVPSMMEDIRVKGRKIFAAGLDERPEEFLEARGDAPEETLRDWVDQHCPSVLDDMAVMGLPALVQSPLLNGALLKAGWATRPLEASPFDLLIADTPLVYMGTFKTSFIVALPIAPRLAFFAFNDQGTWQNLLKQDDNSIIRETNRSSVRQAETYVYATGIRQELFVKKYLRR